MVYHVGHFINGKKISGEQNPQLDLYNPALGQSIGKVALGRENEVEQAVKAAKIAFPAWAETPPIKRARILFAFKERLQQEIENLAKLITEEHGKNIEDAKGSIWRGIELIEFFCGIPHLLTGTYSSQTAFQIDNYTFRQAVGIGVGITPYNFPVMVPIWMFIPAIACGNTFILKPSEKDPSPAFRLAEIIHDSGLPEGVLNIVNGDKETVNQLITHPNVDLVSCVGSTPVAESIYQTAICHGKRSQTFGGAKNHGVILPDANIDFTAQAIANAAYGSAGQRCMAISVVVAVTDKVADKIVDKITKIAQSLIVGPGDNPKTEMGPLITKDHLEKVKNYIALGVQEGAELVVDGRKLDLSQLAQGYYLGPSLFDHVTPKMKIYQEEIFGPVLMVLRVPSLEDAIDLINQNPYGNGTAIFTRDGALANQFVQRVEVGMVGINVPIPVPVAYHSFGGWKKSFYGDLHLHAKESVTFYTKLKTVTERWPNQPQQASYTMPHE